MKPASHCTAVLAGCTAVCLTLSATAANITNITPSVDANWSNPANWLGGVAPTNGDSVVLAIASGITPTNIDIAGLSLDTLAFSNVFSAGVGYTNPVYGTTLVGNDFGANAIACLKGGAVYTNIVYTNTPPTIAVTNVITVQLTATNIIKQNVVFTRKAATNTIPANNVLIYLGVVGETIANTRLYARTGGTIAFYNTNTISGGFKSDYTVLYMYCGDKGLGAVPVTNEPQSIILANDGGSTIAGGCGLRFGSTQPYETFVINTNRGILTITAGRVSPDSNTRVIYNGVITEDAAGRDFRYNGGGILMLGGNNTFSGNFGTQYGQNVAGGVPLVIMDHDWALGRGTAGKKMQLYGTIDVNGHSLPTRNLQGEDSSSGFLSAGYLVNNLIGSICVVSGFYALGGGTIGPTVGGSGNIITLGPLTGNSTGKKVGSGTWTMKGAYSNAWDFQLIGGKLIWDYSESVRDKLLSNRNLQLGSALQINGNDSQPITEAIANIDMRATPSEGPASITINSGNNQNFVLAASNFYIAWERSFDLSIVTNGTGTGKLTTTRNDENLGANCTFNQRSFAAIVGGVVTAVPDANYLTSFVGADSNSYIDITGSMTITGTVTAKGLRFKDPAGTLLIFSNATLNLPNLSGLGSTGVGQNTNLVSAILLTPESGPVRIGGLGTIISGANRQLHFLNYSTNRLLVDVRLDAVFGNGAWCKSGPGDLMVTNRSNNIGGQNGGLRVFGGSVTFDSIANGDQASSLGMGFLGSNLGALKLGNGTLKYIGEGNMSDRVMYLIGDGTIEANGSGELAFTNRGAFIFYLPNCGNNNWLTLSGSGNGRIDGRLDLQVGGLIKRGAGIWTLNATNSYYYGNTYVYDGTLKVNGNIPRSMVTVYGGTLAGTGTFAYLTVNGTVAPGSSIGTINTGYLTFNAGAVYDWEYQCAPAVSDVIRVSGDLTLPDANNSVTVRVTCVDAPTDQTVPLLVVAGNKPTISELNDKVVMIDAQSGAPLPDDFGISGDTITYHKTAPLPSAYVDITDPAGDLAVPNAMAAYAVAGTNSDATVGDIGWSNSGGGSGVVPAASTGWSFNVSLAVGANIIVASGTNGDAIVKADTVTITRAVAPFVAITNGDFAVQSAVTSAEIGGLSTYCVGSIAYACYSNDLSGEIVDAGSFAAAAAWQQTINNLVTGPNVVQVVGTNAYGDQSVDAVTITRQSGNAPSDVADFVIALATGDYSTITLGWSNNTATILVCTNQNYTADLSQWFELAMDVTSPWTHEDASNYPTIFYRIISGVYTSQYDVGKYSVTLAPGTGSDPANNWISPPLELFSNTVGYVLGTQLNYDESNFDILKSQSSIGSDAQVDTYYYAGTWTDFDQESARLATGCGYMLVVDANHTQPKTVAFVGKVPDAVVTNVVSAPNGTDPVYNWIGAPSPALRSFFANGLTNPVVTTEADANFDLYKHQVTMGADAQKDWYYLGGVWDDFESGTPEQTPGKGGMLVLDAIHTGAETTWAAPKTP